MRSVRIVALTAALSLISAASMAGEVSLKLDDSAQSAIGQLPALLDQCVAGITVHGDASVCRNVSNFLTALTNEVRATQAKKASEAAAETRKAADEKAPEKAQDKPKDAPAE
jgi:hypothetical protein